MTSNSTLSAPAAATKALRRAAVRATRAPSVHNTQPWTFVLAGPSLEIRADFTRQLRVLDPRGRQLMLSCGCALFNARASLAHTGVAVTIDRLPEPAAPEVVARLTYQDGVSSEDPRVPELDAAIEERRTNRRQFYSERVPVEVIDAAVDAAAREGAEAFVIDRIEHRLAVARLSQLADRIENADPAYRAELRAWTSSDPSREDGVPAFAVPHVDGAAHDDLPIRDFDTRGGGGLPAQTNSRMDQCLILLGALDENPMAWIRTGEALERMWLELTARGYVAGPLTQVVEVTRANELLRQELGLTMRPHVLVRVGRAPATPPTRRRRLVDVLAEPD